MPSYQLPPIAYVAIAAVLVAAIAAAAVCIVARIAFTKARPDDVPHLLSGLAQLVGAFRTFLPGPGGGAVVITPTKQGSDVHNGQSEQASPRTARAHEKGRR